MGDGEAMRARALYHVLEPSALEVEEGSALASAALGLWRASASRGLCTPLLGPPSPGGGLIARPDLRGLAYSLALCEGGGGEVGAVLRRSDGKAFVASVVANLSYFRSGGSLFEGTLVGTMQGRLILYLHDVRVLAGEAQGSSPWRARLALLHALFHDSEGFAMRAPPEARARAVALASLGRICAGDTMPCQLCLCAAPSCEAPFVGALLGALNPGVHPSGGGLLLAHGEGKEGAPSWRWSPAPSCALELLASRASEDSVLLSVPSLPELEVETALPLVAAIVERLIAHGACEKKLLCAGEVVAAPGRRLRFVPHALLPPGAREDPPSFVRSLLAAPPLPFASLLELLSV
jgi:hypothetical protein